MRIIKKQHEAVFLELEPDDGSVYQVFVAQVAIKQPIKVAMMAVNGRFRGHHELMPDQVRSWVVEVHHNIIEKMQTATVATLGHAYTQNVLHSSGMPHGCAWEAVVMILVAACMAFGEPSDLEVIGHLYRERLWDALPILEELAAASQLFVLVAEEDHK